MLLLKEQIFEQISTPLIDGRNLNLVVKWSEREATFLFDGVRTDYAITGEVSGSIYENPELINS